MHPVLHTSGSLFTLLMLTYFFDIALYQNPNMLKNSNVTFMLCQVFSGPPFSLASPGLLLASLLQNQIHFAKRIPVVQ